MPRGPDQHLGLGLGLALGLGRQRRRRRPGTWVVAVALAAVLLSPTGAVAAEKEPAPVPPAPKPESPKPEPATVGVRVLDRRGKPLVDVCVSYAPKDPINGSWQIGQTDLNGEFSTVVRAEPATLHFADCTHPPRFAPTSRWIEPVAGSLLDVGDIEMPAIAVMSGRVLDASGTPVPGVCATANVVTGNSYSPVAKALSTSDGTYELYVAPGSYLLRFEDCGSGLGLMGAIYGVGPGAEGSLPQKVVTEIGLSGLDMVMTSGRRLSGTVVGPDGAPVDGVCVAVRPAAALAADDWTTVAWELVDDRTGEWSASLPAGSYALEYVNCDPDGRYQTNGPWIAEFHRDLYSEDDPEWSDLSLVVVTDDSDPPPVTADLLRAAQLTGTVVDTAGDPLADVCISGPGVDNDERTPADGRWQATLRPGTHTFVFTDCVPGRGLLQATRVVTVAGGDSDSLDVVLSAAASASVSGRVVNLAGAAMAPACVVAFVPDAVVGIAVADTDGAWTLDGLGAGSYFLGAFNCSDPTEPMLDPLDGTPYPTTWWPDAPADLSRAADPARDGATSIVLHAGEELAGRDFCLPSGCPVAAPPTSTPPPGAAAPSISQPVRTNDAPAGAEPSPQPPGATASAPGPDGPEPAVKRSLGHRASWSAFVAAGTRAAGETGQRRTDELGASTARAVSPPAPGDGPWRTIALVSLTTTAGLLVLLMRSRRRRVRPG